MGGRLSKKGEAMKPENSNEKLPSQQATLRLFAPDGEVYETEADFTVMRVADGDRIEEWLSWL